MKQLLKPTFTGDNASMPFSELLTSLELSEATGLVRATATDGTSYEIRIAQGQARRVTGREGASPTGTLADLLREESLDWSYRATAGEPNGEYRMPLSQLMMGAAFAMESAA